MEKITFYQQSKIVRLFLEGHSVNHIVFLLNFEISIDDVNEAIRAALRGTYQ